MAVDVQIALMGGVAGMSGFYIRGAEDAACAPVLKAGCPFVCGAGAGTVERMGQVQPEGGRITMVTGHAYACDASCCHARGPKCDCSCGGANHGAGILATILTIDDNGTTQARFAAAPKSAADAVKRAAEFRAAMLTLDGAVDVIQAARSALATKRSTSGWLSNDDFRTTLKLRDWLRAQADLKSLRTHQGRLKAIAKLVADVLVLTGANA